jgi:hypothetical protein
MKKKKLSKNSINIYQTANHKTKTNWGLIITIFIIGTFLVSTFAFSLLNSNATPAQDIYEYNSFKFTRTNNYWNLNLKGVGYPLFYLPTDLEDISIETNNLILSGQKYYLLFDPKQFNEANDEITYLKEFSTVRGASVSLACSSEEGCGNLPILNCNSNQNIIYFKNGEHTKLYKQDKCFVLEASPGQEFKVINKYMYFDLGVVND